MSCTKDHKEGEEPKKKGPLGKLKESLDDKEDCPICMDEMLCDHKDCITKCGHLFHFDCLVPALNGTPKCPTCRQPATAGFQRSRNQIGGANL